MSIAEKLARAKEDVDAVFEAGKKSQYDEFWDNYQNYGRIGTNYNGAFAGTKWTKQTFKPKYDITGFWTCLNMFWANTIGGDLVAHLEEIGGIVLDFSDATNAGSCFTYSKFTRLGVIDLRKATTAVSVFALMTNLETIDKIIVSKSTAIQNWFNDDNNLVNVIFEGEITGNGLNVQWCPLSHESLMSIINTLRDNSGTSTWNTITLGADNIAKLTQEELDIMEQKHWEYT
jgi:hypothetical protein